MTTFEFPHFVASVLAGVVLDYIRLYGVPEILSTLERRKDVTLEETNEKS